MQFDVFDVFDIYYFKLYVDIDIGMYWELYVISHAVWGIPSIPYNFHVFIKVDVFDVFFFKKLSI